MFACCPAIWRGFSWSPAGLSIGNGPWSGVNPEACDLI
jgi:hypothetical protein